MPPTAHHFTPTDDEPQIILLDLQGTLSANFNEMKHNPTPENIKSKEKYKLYLVDWLRQIQQVGWEVHLFTVRDVNRRDATLESIKTQTGWQPDCCWFKSEETGKPPEVKAAYLDRLIPERAPSALYAFESNPATRRMFKERAIPCRPMYKENDLPPLSEFVDSRVRCREF